MGSGGGDDRVGVGWTLVVQLLDAVLDPYDEITLSGVLAAVVGVVLIGLAVAHQV